MAADDSRRSRAVWVLGIGVALAVAAALLWQLRDRVADSRLTAGAMRDAPLVMDTSMFRRLPLETVEFLADCGRNPNLPDGPAGQDDFIRRCLHRLSSALDGQARRDTVRGQVMRMHRDAMHQEVAAVARLSGSVVNQTAVVREAMMAQAYLLVQLHRARYREVARLPREVAEARRAARAIDADEPLGAQAELLEGFFRRAGNALYLMEALDTATNGESGAMRGA